MKRSLFLFMLPVITMLNLCAQKPEKIYSIAKVDKPHEYFVQQAEIWWKEIEKDKTNEDAWYNYYKANRYSLMTFDGLNRFDGQRNDDWIKESAFLKEPEEIVRLVEKHIPNTYTYYHLKKSGYPGDSEYIENLQKAYQIKPEDPDIYGGFVTYYEMKGNIGQRKEFNRKLFESNEISSGFLAYGYNVLMSIKPDGIILTFGDNDTFPLWMLQDVSGVRTDITVLNIPLLTEPEYRKMIFKSTGLPDFPKVYEHGSTTESEKEIMEFILKNKPAGRPLYIGLPAWNHIKEYENNLYLVGLALEYSPENIDNIALLKNNFENKYALDYIQNRFEYDMSASIVERMNINYLPGIFKLYEHYVLSGDLTHAQDMKELGLFIAQKGSQEWVNKASAILK